MHTRRKTPEKRTGCLDLINEAMQQGSEWILVPVERLAEDFFHLKTHLAGEIIQKFVTYRRHLVILGNVSQYKAQSRAFRDFVYEEDLGNDVWFVMNLQELVERLKHTYYHGFS